ncbi:MAG: nucleotide sugar dehydrogenase [Actinomycetota bacterium]|nr:nucleotide sugar dehydrogenase [Actinomycetota bacterium]
MSTDATGAPASLVVIGQGYVGLPLALRAVQQGFRVVGFDVAADRIAELRAGRSYVGDVSDAELSAALAAGYVPTDDAATLAGFDVAVISVPTPLRDRQPDLSAVQQAARTLGPHLRAGAVVVLESTTYPGTTEELVGPILDEASGLRAGTDYHLGYSPERIDPGNSSFTLVNTPKVVSGVNESSLAAVKAFYDRIVERTVPVGSPAEAEMTKLLENTFRHINIALVNEMAMFARQLGVDIWRVIDAASTKPFGFMRFTPGPGVGGHCLPVDPSYLSWRVEQHLGRKFEFVELANDINEGMPQFVFERVASLLNDHGKPLNGSRVLLLGLAYKASTSDWRESPTVPLAAQLAASHAEVVVCDPHVAEVTLGQLPYAMVPFDRLQLAAADIVVVMVDHPSFDPQLVAEVAPLVFDAKGLLRGRSFNGEVL